ncbi:MAG TPA: hypothetical protein VHO06_26585 [Polyangia bacterium]|nr:hypothetical protein [Polyangia bacterium]
MTSAHGAALGMLMVGLFACGGGSSSMSSVSGTFDESGSPCVTGNIKGLSDNPATNDPQCTVIEHPGGGGSPVTFGACLDNGDQSPCWASSSCAGGLTFMFNLATTPPAGTTFSYQCTICPVGSSC